MSQPYRAERTLVTLVSLFAIAALTAAPLAAEAANKRGKPLHIAGKPAAEKPQPYGRRADLMEFAAGLAIDENWELEPLRALLAQAQKLPSVQRLIMPAPTGTAKDWATYRARFVEPRRLQAGLRFWEQNADALARAEATYGVPAELIAGLIGVETFYGQITGGFRVLDALATLAFDFPSGRSDRSAFFRTELAEFLKLTRREGLDPLAVKGSYAGALGWPQFMPGSWNRHAVDFDGDGRVDLIASPVDAIGSVANYLVQHGWQRGMTTHYGLAMPDDAAARAQLLAPDIKPSFTLAQLQALGAQPAEAAQAHAGPLAVIELQNGAAPATYWLGTENFYALTRYNWSSYYAMAVLDLGRTLASLRNAGAAKP